jgi:serine/threonine protein kinase/tetratricopeptide (TPR) repeat protein
MDASNTVGRTPALGTTLGAYRIERELGHGGMGVVFLAYDTNLHRQVALKTIPASAIIGASSALLLREARNAAALTHPNICTVYEVGAANDVAFIAMEYVEGRSLRERMGGRPLSTAEILSYGSQAADALAYAHERGVVHRDLKAENAISSDSGLLKIVDFGLARRSDPLVADTTTAPSIVPPGALAGTPYAMAPEQVRGEPADSRTDIWALGVVLYEMASGAKPFDAPGVAEMFSSILRDAPRPLPASVPAALKAVIERCLEKEPARRYQRAGEVKAALDTIQRGVAPWRAWRYHFVKHPLAASCIAAVAIVSVLPFENLTGDPAQEYFSDGLTDETISQLGRLHPQRLSVMARTSSMRYKHRDVPIDQIGRELGVDYVLEGSARREGNRVRITVTLIQAHDQLQRWSEIFERELAGILILQSEIAGGVAHSLALSLLPEEQARLASARTIDPEAFEAYLKGASHATKFNRADLDRALEYFETALRKNPDYALAYAGIGRVWSARQQMGLVAPSEAVPRLKEAYHRASSLDDTLPEAHLGLANTYTWSDWNWAAGEAEFKRAIALRPDYAEARAFFAHYLFIMRRPREALAEVHRALELDPLSDLVLGICGQGFMFAGRPDEAMRAFRTALDTAPHSMVALNGYARALYQAGRYVDAVNAEKDVWSARGDGEMVDALDRGFRSGGYIGAFHTGADLLGARFIAGQRTVNPNAVVVMYLRAGETDKVFEWVDRAMANHSPNMPYVGLGPAWDRVRGDPRMQAVLRKMNLPG